MAERFVGTWRLVSYEFRAADGQVSYPYGRDLMGYLLYNEDGYMSGVLMGANRRPFAVRDLLGGTTEEKVAAADTYVSYCGKYEVQGDKVIHHIELSFFPNWTGVDQERFFEFEHDRLTLSTVPLLIGGTQGRAYLIWERA